MTDAYHKNRVAGTEREVAGFHSMGLELLSRLEAWAKRWDEDAGGESAPFPVDDKHLEGDLEMYRALEKSAGEFWSELNKLLARERGDG